MLPHKLGVNWNCIINCLTQHHSALHLVSDSMTKVLQCRPVPFGAIDCHCMLLSATMTINIILCGSVPVNTIACCTSGVVNICRTFPRSVWGMFYVWTNVLCKGPWKFHSQTVGPQQKIPFGAWIISRPFCEASLDYELCNLVFASTGLQYLSQ